MQSLHPLPYTNPFDGTTKKQCPEKTSWASKVTSYQPPIPARGSEVFVGQKGITDRQLTRARREPADPEKGCMVVTAGEGARSNLGTKFWTQDCSGEAMKLFLVTQPRILPHQEALQHVYLLNKLLADSMLSCWAGRWIKTEATSERALP